jgi:SNF2 family DNA or RNA helicase
VPVPDLSKLLPAERTELALKIQQLSDFELPRLKYWNYDPCSQHEQVETWCRNCGISPRAHQRVGAAWLYARQKALLADQMGLGKTACIALSLAMLKELDQLGRSVVVCRAPAVKQWVRELNRMMPQVNVIAHQGTKRQRFEKILTEWEILVVGRETFVKDVDAFMHLDLTALVIDDVDSLRNHQNKIAANLKTVAKHCRYTYVVNGTPLQKRLEEIHSVTEVIGGREIFGSKTRFLNTYTLSKVIRTPVSGGRLLVSKKVTGFQNLDQFKRLLAPMALRRTPEDLDDIEMPEIIPSTVWLDLHPAQRAKYREIQDGILKIIKSGKLAEMKPLQAMTIWSYAGAVCSSLTGIGEDDGPQASVKLDWVMDKLDGGDLSDEKVVVFINRLNTVRALQARLDEVGIGHVTISGMDSNANRRNAAVQKFWDDTDCRVLIGTQSLESSLNLQVSRHLICVDLVMNPGRMEQLAGRVARQGSKYKTAFVHTLLTRDTQEENYLQKLELESALMNHIWNSESPLFEQLDPATLMQLIVS